MSVETSSGNSVPSEICEDRKLFIGGFPLSTTEKDLRDHFAQFGEIESLQIKTDVMTGRSRGFAFLVYDSIESSNRALELTDHGVNGKNLDVKKAKIRQGKIFVGGIRSDMPEDELREYFGQFGNIVNIEWPFDKIRNQRKGFCFVIFDNDRVANDLVKQPKHTIGERQVDVKKAIPTVAGGDKKPGDVGGTGVGMNGSGVGGYLNPGGYQSGVPYGQPYYVATPNYNFYGAYASGFPSSSGNSFFPTVQEGARFKGFKGRQQNRQQPY